MDATNEDNKQIPPLLDALLSVSDGLIDTEVNRLKYLCRGDVPASELQTVKEGFELFEILQKRLIITETNYSFLLKLLGKIKRKDLEEEFLRNMQTACHSPGLGSQPPPSYASYVRPQTDLRAPRDFGPISPSQAAVAHNALTGLFADIPKPVKDNFTGTNDSTPKNTSECDQSLYMAKTLSKSATNTLPGQSQHLSKTLPRSRSEGPVSSIDGGPCEMKAVYNIDGTPRITASNGQSLHTSNTSQTVLKPATRGLSYEPDSSSGRSPGMKADLSASPNLSGKPMFHPKVSKSSGGNVGGGFGGQASGRDVESLLEGLSLKESSLSRSESASYDLPEDVDTDSPSMPPKQPSSPPNRSHGDDAASLLAMSPETDSPTSSHQPRDDRHRHVVSSPHHGQGSVPWPGSPQQEKEVMQISGEQARGGQGTDNLDETSVHCKKCLAFICRTSELRWKGKNGHVTCIRPDFTARVRETRHERPRPFKNIETLGVIFCQAEGCSQRFGISAHFLKLNLPFGYALNVESFKIQRDGIMRTYKNWKQVLSKDTNT